MTKRTKRKDMKTEATRLWLQMLKVNRGCQVCGYNKTPRALDLHHLDPNKKETYGPQALANQLGWTATIAEVEKCAILCKCCHMEFHDGMLKVELEPTRLQRHEVRCLEEA